MNMIASVLRLDRPAIQALRITDPYSLHRVVYSLYDDIRDDAAKTGSESSGILFADQGGDIRGRNILLLANRPPQDHVGGRWGKVESQHIPAGFLDHDHYRFQVTVNPTRRNNASRKLVPVKGREEIAAWFAERAPTSWGFHIDTRHLQVDRVQVQRFKDKHQHPVTLAQAHVQGVLKVAEREQFTNSFQQGIGRGRTFGCGLLQIIPLDPSSLA